MPESITLKYSSGSDNRYITNLTFFHCRMDCTLHHYLPTEHGYECWKRVSVLWFSGWAGQPQSTNNHCGWHDCWRKFRSGNLTIFYPPCGMRSNAGLKVIESLVPSGFIIKLRIALFSMIGRQFLSRLWPCRFTILICSKTNNLYRLCSYYRCYKSKCHLYW